MTTIRQKLAFFMIATVLLASVLLPVAPTCAGGLLATGQTTAYQAHKHTSLGPTKVPDDGTLQRGVVLRYKVLQDGTIKDLTTGLIWEVKCVRCQGLHNVDNLYYWSGNGSMDTIWDWLDDINAEGGTGYAGHHDWRIPNLQELESIVDYGRHHPAIDPIFGPTSETDHWSSTSYVYDLLHPDPLFGGRAWFVDFGEGLDGVWEKSWVPYPRVVRAVRGGPAKLKLPKVPLLN